MVYGSNRADDTYGAESKSVYTGFKNSEKNAKPGDIGTSVDIWEEQNAQGHQSRQVVKTVTLNESAGSFYSNLDNPPAIYHNFSRRIKNESK